MKLFRRMLHSTKGVAMLMALITLTLLGFLVARMIYETEVYHRVVFNAVDELRARTLARAGLRMALLQIHASNKATAKAKNLGGAIDNSLLDKIWETQLVLPVPLLPGLGVAEKSALEEFNKAIDLKGRVSIRITGESQKLNLNSLVWAAQTASSSTSSSSGTAVPGATTLTPEARKEQLQATRKFFAETINQLLQNKRQADDSFREKYSSLTGETLVADLLAWIDPDTTVDAEGRNKDEYYSRLVPRPLGVKSAPLFSVSELHMIKGHTDDITKLLEEHFTVLTTTGINVNTAPLTLIAALFPELSPVDVERMMARRSDPDLGGPFKNAEDFWKHLETFGRMDEAKDRLAKNKIEITTDETGYRVILEASSGFANKVWVAYVGVPPPEPPATPGTSSNSNNNNFDITGSADDIARSGTNNNAAKNDNKVPSIIYLKSD